WHFLANDDKFSYGIPGSTSNVTTYSNCASTTTVSCLGRLLPLSTNQPTNQKPLKERGFTIKFFSFMEEKMERRCFNLYSSLTLHVSMGNIHKIFKFLELRLFSRIMSCN
ncbi:hypothetical protein L7F22_055974, partial [Adiantum nelumboides]|nr:hypothetical protein [Adiantum nelumboides]